MFRWRYSQRLGGDFLGLSQAFKSVALTKSPTLRNLQTGKNAIFSKKSSKIENIKHHRH